MRHGSRGRRRRGGVRPRPRARRRRLRRSARGGGRRLTRHVPPVVRPGDAPGRRAPRRRGAFARGPTAEGCAPRIRAVLPRRRRGCRGGLREPRREDVHPIPLRAPPRPLRRHNAPPRATRVPRLCARRDEQFSRSTLVRFAVLARKRDAFRVHFCPSARRPHSPSVRHDGVAGVDRGAPGGGIAAAAPRARLVRPTPRLSRDRPRGVIPTREQK